jgi:hypothetical protein
MDKSFEPSEQYIGSAYNYLKSGATSKSPGAYFMKFFSDCLASVATAHTVALHGLHFLVKYFYIGTPLLVGAAFTAK